MLTNFRADLHIHTVLSPCAELEMLPGLIISAAEMAGLDLIAICDHNSCENTQAVIEASLASSIKVMPGIEVQTLEGVHILCIFENMDCALQMQNIVYRALPDLDMPDKQINEQLVVDSVDEFVNYCTKPIAMPVSIDLNTICIFAAELGGLIIPSHIDRHGSGLLDVLGYLPEDIQFDALELSANANLERIVFEHPEIAGQTFIRSSDAHWLWAIGEHPIVMRMLHRTLNEMKMAFNNKDGRSVEIA